MTRLFIAIEVPEGKTEQACLIAAQNAALFAGGELRSAFLDKPLALGLLNRWVGGLRARTELFPTATEPISPNELALPVKES